MKLPEAAGLVAEVDFTDDAAVYALAADVFDVAVSAPFADGTNLCKSMPLVSWFRYHLLFHRTGADDLYLVGGLLGTLG